MKKVQPKEAPRITNRDILTCDDDFVDIDSIRNQCLCIHNSTCIQIVKLLQQWKYDLADSKIEWLRNYIEG